MAPKRPKKEKDIFTNREIKFLITDTFKSDRTLKRETNKDTNEFVIKCSLLGSLEEKSILENINQRVLSASKFVHKLSLATNLFVRDLFNGKDYNDLSEMVVPKFLSGENDTFLYQMMLSQANVIKPDPDITLFLEKYKDFLPQNPERFKQDTNTLVYATKGYRTNYRTYLQENLDKVQDRFLGYWCSKNDHPEVEEWRVKLAMKYFINGSSSLPEWMETFDFTEAELNEIKRHKTLLKNNSVFGIKDYEQTLVYFAFCSRKLEIWTGKCVTLAPLSQIKSHFITIDKNVFWGILKDTGLITCNFDTFKEFSEDHYSSVFKYTNLLTIKQKQIYKFTGTIQTDGISICYHFRRPNLPLKERKEISYTKNERVIGLDPGRTNLVYAVEKIGNKYKKYKLTKRCYYQESGITEGNKRKDIWNGEIKDALVDLSLTTSKSRKLIDFLDYTRTIQRNYNVLWEEYTKQRWGFQRFRNWSGKQSVLNKFFSKMKNGIEGTVAFGNAKFSSTAKNETSAPTTIVSKVCKKYFRVIGIDEYNTSQVAYSTNTKMAKVRVTGQKYSLRGLLWCGSTSKGKFIGRDFNAAVNILNCFVNETRPIGLQRTTKLDKPSFEILL